MAWEETIRQGNRIMTGDKPMDEMSFALKKIVSAYADRFERKPLLCEILYALETVIEAQPGNYISDADALGTQTIFAN